MKQFFKEKKGFATAQVVGSILGALSIFSCSSDTIDEQVNFEASNVNQIFSAPTTGIFYTIQNRNSGRFMEIADASNADEANLRQSGTSVTPTETHRMWEIFNTTNGFIRIRGVDSRRSLEVRNGSNSNGANVEQRAFGGLTHQEWEILPTNNGYFRIRSRDSRKTMAVENGSNVNGANIEIDTWDGSDRFQWAFIEVGNEVADEPSSNENEFGLNSELEPWENFDLSDWGLDTPAPRANDICRAVRINEDEWDTFRESISSDYFFTHTDGGMRFVSPVGGVTTSSSCTSGFPRTELREQLRAGDRSISTTGVTRNNWALGYQPANSGHGGRNGRLAATLRINQVTTTGDEDRLHPGRTIIGQIHALSDEPARLYYRKCPDAEFGSIYLEHEIRDGSDVTFNLIGSELCDGNGPSNGIRLDELFSYEIINDDADISVIIRRGDIDGPIIASVTLNMDDENSGYDLENEWMYFKAGLYTQNNTGDNDDTDVATFYRLSNTHDNNCLLYTSPSPRD